MLLMCMTIPMDYYKMILLSPNSMYIAARDIEPYMGYDDTMFDRKTLISICAINDEIRMAKFGDDLWNDESDFIFGHSIGIPIGLLSMDYSHAEKRIIGFDPVMCSEYGRAGKTSHQVYGLFNKALEIHDECFMIPKKNINQSAGGPTVSRGKNKIKNNEGFSRR